jgi:hypothetical protein
LLAEQDATGGVRQLMPTLPPPITIRYVAGVVLSATVALVTPV